jgi:hypothetical protein
MAGHQPHTLLLTPRPRKQHLIQPYNHPYQVHELPQGSSIAMYVRESTARPSGQQHSHVCAIPSTLMRQLKGMPGTYYAFIAMLSTLNDTAGVHPRHVCARP